MSAAHGSTQGPGTGNVGNGGGGNEDDDKSRTMRKYETAIILLVGLLGGVFAGGLHRAMEKVSYYQAGTTAVLATSGLTLFIIGIVRFARGQS
ncbi:hypothetical protein AB0N92_06375 [Streptomyces sp. NPDC093248]|uniref:hypothetical protein n=1 Tax=Streptomyces sp. NPDC093248 TaxID=3155072 RepID=UPI00341D0974